jgi:SAM-dependent methyltransferase
MGILLNAAYLMLIEGKRQPFHGKVLQLGKQSVLFSYPMLKNIAAHVGFELKDIGLDSLEERRLTDIEFFTVLGFEEVKALEYGTAEGADFVWDMNYPIENALHNQFDFIYDGGTVEHVFHVPNCLDNICRMLKVGGRVIHDGGVSGCIDHGFYALQPTLFYDFYHANELEVGMMTVSKLNLETWLTHTGVQVPYVPGMYDFNKTWSFEKDTFYVGICFATKKHPYREMVLPQQSLWSRM